MLSLRNTIATPSWAQTRPTAWGDARADGRVWLGASVGAFNTPKEISTVDEGLLFPSHPDYPPHQVTDILSVATWTLDIDIQSAPISESFSIEIPAGQRAFYDVGINPDPGDDTTGGVVLTGDAWGSLDEAISRYPRGTPVEAEMRRGIDGDPGQSLQWQVYFAGPYAAPVQQDVEGVLTAGWMLFFYTGIALYDSDQFAFPTPWLTYHGVLYDEHQYGDDMTGPVDSSTTLAISLAATSFYGAE